MILDLFKPCCTQICKHMLLELVPMLRLSIKSSIVLQCKLVIKWFLQFHLFGITMEEPLECHFSWFALVELTRSDKHKLCFAWIRTRKFHKSVNGAKIRRSIVNYPLRLMIVELQLNHLQLSNLVWSCQFPEKKELWAHPDPNEKVMQLFWESCTLPIHNISYSLP